MLKTLLKSALIVIVLAGIFFAALQLWEIQRKKSAPPTPTEEAKTPEAPAVTLTKLDVQPAGEGATLQLSDVATTHRLSPASDGKSLSIEMFGSQVVSMVQKSWVRPHPLISTIDVSTGMVSGAHAVVIRVIFTREADVRDRYVGKTLFVDVTPRAAQTFTPTPVPTATPEPKKEVKKSKPTVKHAIIAKKKTKAPSKKTAKHAVKSKPTPMEDFAPPPPPSETMMEPAPELPPPPAVEPVAEAPKPKKPETKTPPSSDANNLDLDKLFAESQTESVPSEPPRADEPPAGPTPAQVAALPHPSAGTFDKSKISRDLPKIVDLAVQGQGGATVVTIAHDPKTKHKFFKMRNPNRIVVEFQNAQNTLQAEYPGFAGTKILRITTQEFKGDETKTRITLFLKGSGDPQFDSSSKANSLVVTIP